MPVQDYLEAKKRIKKEIDTLIFKIYSAYNAAEEKLIEEDGLLNLESLEDAVKRKDFKSELITKLREDAKTYFETIGTNFQKLDDLKQNSLFSAYLGTTETNIQGIIEGYKGSLNSDHFMEETQNLIQPRLKELQQYPLSKLNQTDALEAVKYTKLEGKVNASKLELKDIAGLLDNFEKFGVVPPKFLENKNYLV